MLIRTALKDFLHLFYPRTCLGCLSDVLFDDQLLCIRCISELPHTNFAFYESNPVEKLFQGRVRIRAAHSEFFFAKNELIQQLIHLLKYKSNKEIGKYLGSIMGETLIKSNRFQNIDYLVPLPLYQEKEFKRGYNQAEVICHGISETTTIPIISKNVERIRATDTQTRKHRTERWENVAGSFTIRDELALEGKHILLVDDVLTTGATLEACSQSIKKIKGTTLSIAVLAHASK